MPFYHKTVAPGVVKSKAAYSIRPNLPLGVYPQGAGSCPYWRVSKFERNLLGLGCRFC